LLRKANPDALPGPNDPRITPDFASPLFYKILYIGPMKPKSTAENNEPQASLCNWAGNLKYGTSTLMKAASTDEIRFLVKKHDRLKVLGTRHCFNTIADSGDRFLSLDALDKIGPLDQKNHTVTVEAGVRYGELAAWLDSRGFALHNLASLPHISIAGGCATATHGSGIRNGNLSTAIRAISFILASGETLTLSRDQDKEQFPGAVVNLGALGVVTSLTLDIQPAFRMRQYVYENLPFQHLVHHFEEIMTAGYSVSLFTSWRSKHIDEVWIKIKVEQGIPEEFPAVFFDAKAATSDLHPIRDVPAENCTPQMGLEGPWHERLPHFRMNFMPSSGKELQTEYFIPLERSYEALVAVGQLHEKIAPHLLISEIRCIAADDLWMSPCYRQPSTAIHFTWRQDWSAVSRLLPLIEERLAPFGAKPHWGKLFSIAPGPIASLYERFPDFIRLVQQYDPTGKFRNDWLDRILSPGLR
jgi:alditol oxidase